MGCAPAGAGGKPAATAADTASTPGPEASDAWSRRGERSTLETFIADRTAATQRDAKDFAAWIQLARAHAFMADATLALGWGDASSAVEHLARARAAALSALSARDEALANELRAQRPLRQDALTEDTASALYWYGKSLHAHAKLIDHAERVASEPMVAAAARACAARVPAIDHGGAHRLLGELAAHPAEASTRDLASARAHFERALSVDATHAENARAYAEHFAVPAQERALFESLIARTEQTANDTPEDAVARARTQSLKARIEEHFE